MTSPSDDLDPTRFESATFELVRRGFDPAAVRGELQRAAQEIRRLRLERDEMAGRLAEFDGVPPEALEAHRVAEALGAEAMQVLEAAHQAAKERADRAEREADAVRDEALAVADAARAEGQAAREQLLEDARREAEAIMEDGRSRGRDMVSEAQTVRERMLRDLARKRQTGRAQVEQLRAGRDRLLESLTIAQQSLDVAVLDLVNSVPEARSAAERAGLRVTSESTPTPDELEGEIEAARLVGHPLLDDVADPGPVEDSFITGEMEALTHLDVLGDTDSDVVIAVAPEAVTVDTDGEDAAVEPPADDDPAVEDPAVEEPAVEYTAAIDDDSIDESAVEDTVDDESVEDTADDESVEDTVDGEPDEDTVGDDPTELYDVESEETIHEDPEPEETAGEAAAAEEPVVDDVFARLRSSQEAEESADADADGDAPAETDAATPEPDDAPEAEVEAEPEVEVEAEPESAPDAIDDARAAARTAAADAAAKAMKKVLVEEQGALLDGIRRSGADAVRFVVDDAATQDNAYVQAATPALKDLAGALGGSKRLKLTDAFAQIQTIALEPVRQRLADVAERVDDPDELSDTVRAVYRESRSRRVAEAAAAAAVAVDGLVAVATAGGPVVWHVDPNGPCGPDCADNALAGAVEAGAEFPTGDRHPPAHPACTCWLEVAPGG